MSVKRIVLGITGATGAIIGVRTLEALERFASDIERHLIVTPAAQMTIKLELGDISDRIERLATRVYDYNDIAAPIASGSYKTIGMIVAPLSMRSLSDIATSRGANLLARAADVTLKENRKLVLAPRETPMSALHLQLALRVAEAGALMLFPSPAFYMKPETVEDIVDYIVGKALDLFDIEHTLFKRWGEQ